MSELQLGLIALGVVAVAGVWGFNAWQERRHRKLAESVFRGNQPDVLLGGDAAAPGPGAERIEPVVHDLPAAAAEPIAADGAGSVGMATVTDRPAAAAAPSAAESVPPVDEVADVVARLSFARRVTAPALWAAQADWAGRIDKPLSWLGLDEAAQAWRPIGPHDAHGYGRVLAALQVADRQGAVSEAMLGSFYDGVDQVAARLDGTAELPPPAQVLAHALALDDFCAQVDIQLTVNVVAGAGGSIAGTKLRGLAEAAGLALGDDGLFHARDDAGHTLYTLGNLGAELFAADALRTLATQGVSLTLDVPRVAEGARVYRRMIATAQQLAHGLDGVLVDAQRAPLTAAMIDGIGAKIDELQARMNGRGIAPGSARALRLFS